MGQKVHPVAYRLNRPHRGSRSLRFRRPSLLGRGEREGVRPSLPVNPTGSPDRLGSDHTRLGRFSAEAYGRVVSLLEGIRIRVVELATAQGLLIHRVTSRTRRSFLRSSSRDSTGDSRFIQVGVDYFPRHGFSLLPSEKLLWDTSRVRRGTELEALSSSGGRGVPLRVNFTSVSLRERVEQDPERHELWSEELNKLMKQARRSSEYLHRQGVRSRQAVLSEEASVEGDREEISLVSESERDGWEQDGEEAPASSGVDEMDEDSSLTKPRSREEERDRLSSPKGVSVPSVEDRSTSAKPDADSNPRRSPYEFKPFWTVKSKQDSRVPAVGMRTALRRAGIRPCAPVISQRVAIWMEDSRQQSKVLSQIQRYGERVSASSLFGLIHFVPETEWKQSHGLPRSASTLLREEGELSNWEDFRDQESGDGKQDEEKAMPRPALLRSGVEGEALKYEAKRLPHGGYRGYRIQVKGRLDGSRRTRTTRLQEGILPRSSSSVPISFGQTSAKTKYGSMGVSVTYAY